MSIFTPGRSQQITQSGDPSSADIATRLAAIKLILGQLGRGSQSFGDYLKHGPQRMNPMALNGLGNDLLTKASAPGAFTRGPTVQTQRPSSPSTFQDIAGGLPLLLMLNQLGKGGAPTGLSVQEQLLARALGVDPSTLKQPQESPGLFSQIGSGISGYFGGGGATAPATSGQSFDPSAFESQDLGMSIDPNASGSALDWLYNY